MVSLGTAVYQSSRRIQDLLQAVNLFLRNSDEQAVLIVTAGKDECTDQCLGCLHWEGATNRFQPAQLVEAAADCLADVRAHRQVTVERDSKQLNLHLRLDWLATDDKGRSVYVILHSTSGAPHELSLFRIKFQSIR